ncbi:hypothetical protein N431DRAFT_487677 [Stipitochalara longipes BDJ]|nr:hypothetical protein N431DRAFT_487677 [Stipitochalara longipes BDJ]
MLSYDGYKHGRRFHHIILISTTLIFFASLVLLILSIYYYNQVINDPSFISPTADGAILFLYLASFPILTLIRTPIQLFPSKHSRFITPQAMVALESAFILAWIAAAAIWSECEIVLPGSDALARRSWCPRSRLSVPTMGGIVYDQGLTVTKDALGWVVVAGCGMWAVSARVALWKEDMENEDEKHRLELDSC